MAISRRTGRSRFTLVLLVLVSIVILTLDFRDAAIVQRARDVTGDVLSPVRRAAESAFEPIENAWNGITDYGELKAENERLRERLEEIEGDLALDEAAAEQLAELLRQEDIPWVDDLDHRTARVIAGPTSNFVHTIDIDKGSDHGIRVGMPVVTGSGLLGRVVQVTGGRATVQTINDPEIRVGIRVARLNALGTAWGQGNGEPLRVDTGIPPEEESKVMINGLVTTSGADRSAFPPDIPVGRILSTDVAGSGLNLELLVRPMASVHELSYVKVLLWEAPE